MTPYQLAIRDFLVGHLHRGTPVACLIGGKDQDLQEELSAIIDAQGLDVWVDHGLLDRSLRQRMGLAHLTAECEGRFAPRATLTVVTGHAGCISEAGTAFMSTHPDIPVGYVFRPTPGVAPDFSNGLSTHLPRLPRAVDPLAPEHFRLTPPRSGP